MRTLFGFNGGEGVLFQSARGGRTFEEGGPLALVQVFQAVLLDGSGLLLQNGDALEGLFAVQGDFPPGLLNQGMRLPGVSKVIIVGKVAYHAVIAPAVFCRLVLGDIGGDDGGVALGNGLRGSFVLPHTANLTERLQGVIVHQTVPVGGYVQDKVAIGIIIRYNILLN